MDKDDKAQLKIYGRSDDLIEIEGDVSDEIGWFDSGKCYITISDAPIGDNDNYSDVLILPLGHFTTVKWIIYSGTVIKAKEASHE